MEEIKSPEVRAVLRRLYDAPDGFIDTPQGKAILERCRETVAANNPEDLKAFDHELTVLELLG